MKSKFTAFPWQHLEQYSSAYRVSLPSRVYCVQRHSTRRWRLVVVSCCHVYNLLSTIDEMFIYIFTQVTIYGSYMFLFYAGDIIRVNIKLRKIFILFQKARHAWTTDCVTGGYITHFRYSSIRPICGFSEKLIRVATIYLIKYLSPEVTNCLIYLQVFCVVYSPASGKSARTQMEETRR